MYLAFFLALAGIGVLLANPISNQVKSFTHSLPHLVDEANTDDRQTPEGDLHRLGVHVQLAEQGKTALQTHLGQALQERQQDRLVRRQRC